MDLFLLYLQKIKLFLSRKIIQRPQVLKRSVFIPIPKKGNAKECSNYHTIALISHARKVMLKVFQARLQQYANHELPDVQGFRKGRGTRDQITNIFWITEKAREFQKNIYFYFIDYTKALDCVNHNLGLSYSNQFIHVWGYIIHSKVVPCPVPSQL